MGFSLLVIDRNRMVTDRFHLICCIGGDFQSSVVHILESVFVIFFDYLRCDTVRIASHATYKIFLVFRPCFKSILSIFRRAGKIAKSDN